MLQDRTWIDPSAEAEFWKQMAQLEIAHTQLGALGRWTGLFAGGPFRRAALQRDIEAIRGRAQDLVDRHTILVAAASPIDGSDALIQIGETQSDDPLRRLAGMVVSLKQDRVGRAGMDEEKAG